jgi:hypothetical protein
VSNEEAAPDKSFATLTPAEVVQNVLFLSAANDYQLDETVSQLGEAQIEGDDDRIAALKKDKKTREDMSFALGVTADVLNLQEPMLDDRHGMVWLGMGENTDLLRYQLENAWGEALKEDEETKRQVKSVIIDHEHNIIGRVWRLTTHPEVALASILSASDSLNWTSDLAWVRLPKV